MEHDRIVLTGTISFHYFAGSAAAGKRWFRLRGEGDGLQTHFRIFRTDGPGEAPDGASGDPGRNPVHEDIIEAVTMASPTFLVNTSAHPGEAALRPGGRALAEGHEEGAHDTRRFSVFGSAKRYPGRGDRLRGRLSRKDINLIQSHRRWTTRSSRREPGGVLILLAECPDGFGSPTFSPGSATRTPTVLERELRANYQIVYGQTAHTPSSPRPARAA